jgi:hypothetical protein
VDDAGCSPRRRSQGPAPNAFAQRSAASRGTRRGRCGSSAPHSVRVSAPAAASPASLRWASSAPACLNILNYRLIADEGATSAFTVGYFLPIGQCSPAPSCLGTGRLEPVRRHRRGAAWRLPHRRPPAKPRPGHRATRSSQADTRTWRSTRHADLATPADSTRYCRSRHSSARPGDPVEGSGERCLYGVAPLGSVTGVSGTAAGRPSPIWQELPGAVGCLGEVWGSLSRQYWSSKRRSTRPVGPKRCRTTRSSAARLSSCAHGRTGPRMCRSPMRSATWDSCPVLREVGQLWG